VCVCVLFRCGSCTCSVHTSHASPFLHAPVFSAVATMLGDMLYKGFIAQWTDAKGTFVFHPFKSLMDVVDVVECIMLQGRLSTRNDGS